MIRLKHKPALLLLPLLALSTSASALQILDAKEGETLFAKISQKEVTRISIDKGRIRKVTGNAGEFVLEKDDDRGQVFIRPAQSDSTKPINLFVSTDRSTVALLLQPIDSPSDTIMIREARDSGNPSTRRGRSSTHMRTVKNLLLALAADVPPEDMEVSAATRELTLWPDVRLTLQRTVLTTGVIGEKFQLTNNTGTDLDLTERDLNKPGVMAVSLEQRQLRPGESTNLFVIRERRSHE
jgi:conjugal transfer pilus assembly protein TraK